MVLHILTWSDTDVHVSSGYTNPQEQRKSSEKGKMCQKQSDISDTFNTERRHVCHQRFSPSTESMKSIQQYGGVLPCSQTMVSFFIYKVTMTNNWSQLEYQHPIWGLFPLFSLYNMRQYYISQGHREAYSLSHTRWDCDESERQHIRKMTIIQTILKWNQYCPFSPRCLHWQHDSRPRGPFEMCEATYSLQ